MSTFPGAVRSGLLGDRDNRAEIDTSSAPAGWDSWAPKRWDLRGREPQAETHCPVRYKQSPCLPLGGDGELAPIQEEGRSFYHHPLT